MSVWEFLLMSTLTPKECLDALHFDLHMLKDGTWIPTDKSCEAAIIVIQHLARLVNVELAEIPEDMR